MSEHQETPQKKPARVMKPGLTRRTWELAKKLFAGLRASYDSLTPSVRIPFVVTCVLVLVALFGEYSTSSDGWAPSSRALDPSEVITRVHNRLTGFSVDLDSARERMLRDTTVIRAIEEARQSGPLFMALQHDDSLWRAQSPDALVFIVTSDGQRTLPRGSAVYNAEGRILAWHSSEPATFNFDSVLTGQYLLETRDRGTFTLDGPVYAYLETIRKVTGSSGGVLGYVVVKRLLAMKVPLVAGSQLTFIDDIRERSRREVTLDFGPGSAALNSDREWTRATLLASSADPNSLVGKISVSDYALTDLSGLYAIFHFLRGLSLTLVFVLLAMMVITRSMTIRSKDQPLVRRIVSTVTIVVTLAATRLILAQFDGIELLFPQAAQEARDFASGWGFGVLQNPLELFITTLFASIGSILLWLLWMPRHRLVRDDSHRKNIDQVVRRERWQLLIFLIAALFGAQFLTDALDSVIGDTVTNGTIHYLVVHQVLPAAPVFTMYLAFIGIGITYLFLTPLILTFALRGLIFLVPREYSLKYRITFGAILFLGLALVVALIEHTFEMSEVDLNYRIALTIGVVVVSTIVIVVDAYTQHPYEHTPSFLYRLPRSARGILFIMAAGALIVSPIIARKQLQNDLEVAKHIVTESTEVDEPSLSTAAERLLSSANDAIDNAETNQNTQSLRETAFIVWLSSLAEHQDWSAVIDVQDVAGHSLSHFATFDAATSEPRIAPLRDSALREVMGDAAGPSRMALRAEACFTSSCTPIVVGALRSGTSVETKADSVAGPNAKPRKSPLLVSVALWSDLPALRGARPAFDLFRNSYDESNSNELLTEGGYVIALYRPNFRRLTNAPSLDVPASIPLSIQKRLSTEQSFWRKTVLNGSDYETYYYRTDVSQTLAQEASVISASVPLPSLARTAEFLLRLNAVGLIYGTLISLVILLFRSIQLRRIKYTLRFRDRIFFIVLLIALLPLVVVTNVTRTLLSQRAHIEEKDRLARDAATIKERIGRELETSRAGFNDPALQNLVRDLSDVTGRDFAVYDAHGIIRAASRPEFYESSLISSMLSPMAMTEVVYGRKTFLVEPFHIGNDTYQVGYQPITSTQGSVLLGAVSLATLEEHGRIEREIARTTSFIYGTFAALGLVLLGIGALFAARVASPIVMLIQATQRVAQGKLRTLITVNREDEIGELMHAFNDMTSELEKSREIVAQTERELAWKQMARQVAHEIKNPLTPMKLSVQHIEHAHESKDPNFSSIFRRVIRTLGEQIDVLTRIATEFSRFGEMPRRNFGAVSLRKVTDSAVALFDAERSRLRFILDIPKDISDIHADEEEFRRALVNLIRNAVQAIDGWGVIVIRATQDRGMIHMKLSDTGGGMSEETVKKAFDPNFSTKTSGMGLGLAIVKKTITDMSGTIQVESKQGHGTTFYIDLPARGYVEPDEDEEFD